MDKLSLMPEEKFEALLRIVRILGAVAFLAVMLLVSGCRSKEVVTPPPAEAQCDAICYAHCVGEDKDTGIRWEGSPTQSTTIDDLEHRVIPELSGALRNCELRRKACVKCLDNLENKNIIRQPIH
jgi:hypothetical protein